MLDLALAQLRAATRDLHTDLERRLFLASPGAGREQYVTYLTAMHGWLAPIEKRLWQGDWPVSTHVGERAGKTSWIEEDLRVAGFDQAAIAALPVCLDVPPLTSMAERVGVAYVIEGSQLGAQVLRKRLAPALDGWSPRWLQAYGDDTARLWKGFLADAEELLPDDNARQDAARSANAAFTTLRAWFQARGAAALL